MALGGAANAANTGLVLEEVIVTAQKRSENLQDVPVAVSAFSSKTRDLVGISTIQDFTNFTPGVTYSTSLDRMNIRGVGRFTNNLSTSPGVATYGDGFYDSSNHRADTSALFTDQVEILRGPQGTLYGRNSIGGAINVVSVRPTDAFEGEVRATAANFDQQRVEGLLRGPISDSIGFVLGGGIYKQKQGFVENVVGMDEEGEQNERYALAELSFKLGDVADVWLKYAYSKWDNGWGNSVQITPFNTAVRCTPAPPATTCATLLNPGSLGPSALFNTGTGVTTGGVVFNLRPAVPQYTTPNPGVLDHRQVRHDTPQHETLAPENQFVLQSTFHLSDSVDLKYIGGYHNYTYVLYQDYDNADRKSYTYTPPSGVNPVEVQTQVVTKYVEDRKFYSNELNLTSTGDGPLQWIVGGYQYHEYYEQPVTVGTALQQQLATPLTLLGAPAAPNPTRDYSSTDAHITTTSLAGFGQVDYNFTDSWKATLGVRYTKDKKEGSEYLRYITWNPTLTGSNTAAFDITSTVAAAASLGANVGKPMANGFYSRRLETDSNATTGTAGIEWKPNDSGMTYLKYTRGYKDAAINSGSFVAVPYSDPEFVNAYELGWKQDFGGRLQTNASIFYYDYKAAQIPLSLIRGVGLPNVTQTFNLDEKILGVELESIWAATDALQVIFNYSYVEPELKDDGCYADTLDTVLIGPNPCASGGHKIDGNRVPNQPRNKVALNGLYTFDFSPGSLTLSASWLWRDTQYASIFNRTEFLLPAYDQTDLRATWTNTANSYSIIGFVRNVFDDEGFDGIAAVTSASGIVQSYSLTPPRQFGLEVQFRFGNK